MNRLFILALILVSAVGQIFAADEVGSYTLKVGRQIGPEELKAGDTIVFRNAMTNYYERDNEQQDLTRVFLCGTRLVDSRGWGGTVVPTLGVLTGLTTDNFFVAEKATAIKDPNGKSYPAFIFKHVDTGKYITMTDNNDHGGSGLGSKSVATAFALGYAVGYTTNTNYTENQNEKTAYLFRYINGVKFHFGPAWNYGFTEQTKNKDNICWNIFEPTYGEATPYDYVLSTYSQWSSSNFSGYEFGKDPGFYDDIEALYAMEDLIWEIGNKISTSKINEANAAEWAEKLETAEKALEESHVPMTEGYYYIINAGAQFSSTVIEKRCMTANGIHAVNWGILDKSNPFHFFKISALTDSTWSVQNVCTGEYVGGLNENLVVKTSSTPVSIKFREISNYPEWVITDEETNAPYNAYNYGNGTGTVGSVKTVVSSTGHNTSTAWIFEKETNQATIDKMIADGKALYASAAIKEVLADAKDLYTKVKEYQEMISTSVQIKSNAIESTKGSYGGLVDGNDYSYFQSEFTTDKAGGPHNLQIDLGSGVSVSKFKFSFKGLTPETGVSAHDTPNDIEIYATNNEKSGRSARSTEDWVKITHLENLPLEDSWNVSYSSNEIQMDQLYRYLRFVVLGTTSGSKNELSGEKYFNLTSFQIYSADSEESQYNAVPGMKDACDKMEELIVSSETKMAQGKITQTDIDALYEAVCEVQALYVDRDALDKELEELVAEADELYTSSTSETKVLLTDPSQLLVNSQNDSSFPVEELIDGKIEGYAGMESVWHEQMTKDNTASGWESWLAKNRNGAGQVGIGYGYHNFQVAFKEPVANFYMMIYGRDNTDYHDTPCVFEILATNDDKLGADPDNANASQWTKIMDLDATDDIPNERKVVYTSPVIQLGAAYKYVRFVIKNTTVYAKGTLRSAIKNPAITGVTWNAIEWQLYSKTEAKDMLYYNNEDMKAAVDAMKALADEDRNVPKQSMNSKDKVNELRAAIGAVYEMKSYIEGAKSTEMKKPGIKQITTLGGIPISEKDLQPKQYYIIDGKVVYITE